MQPYFAGKWIPNRRCSALEQPVIRPVFVDTPRIRFFVAQHYDEITAQAREKRILQNGLFVKVSSITNTTGPKIPRQFLTSFEPIALYKTAARAS